MCASFCDVVVAVVVGTIVGEILGNTIFNAWHAVAPYIRDKIDRF